jgi:hypothetical protein
VCPLSLHFKCKDVSNLTVDSCSDKMAGKIACIYSFAIAEIVI